MAAPKSNDLGMTDTDERKIRHLHEKLLYITVAIDYLHPSIRDGIPLERFRANCRRCLEDPLSRNLERPNDILEELESKGIVSIGKYVELKDLVDFDKRLVQEINRVEMAIACHGGKITKCLDDDGMDQELAVELYSSDAVNGLEPEAAKEMKSYFSEIISHGNQLLKDKKYELYKEYARRWKVYTARATEIVQTICYFHQGEIRRSATESAIESLGRCKDELFKETDDFYQVQECLRETVDALVRMSSIDTLLNGKGATLQGTIVGSMHLFITFENVEDFDTFMKSYANQELTKEVLDLLTRRRKCFSDRVCGLTIMNENADRYRRFINFKAENRVFNFDCNPKRREIKGYSWDLEVDRSVGRKEEKIDTRSKRPTGVEKDQFESVVPVNLQPLFMEGLDYVLALGFPELTSSGLVRNRVWTNKLYFYSDIDDEKGAIYGIESYDDLEFLHLIKSEENISKVLVYKQPIDHIMLKHLRALNFYHRFIVFKTDKSWWSIEKVSEGITIQRCASREGVTQSWRYLARLGPVEFVVEEEGSESVNNLFKFLKEEKELSMGYNTLFNNCTHFVSRLFKYLTKKKFTH